MCVCVCVCVCMCVCVFKGGGGSIAAGAKRPFSVRLCFARDEEVAGLVMGGLC